MSTSIEWTANPDGTPGEVWNPVVGCSHASMGCLNCYAARDYMMMIDGVIAGCESGPKARPCDERWVKNLCSQCKAAPVPFFLKQLVRDGKLVSLPELDGRQWIELPWRKDA